MRSTYDVRALDHRDRLLVGTIILDGPTDIAQYVEDCLASGFTFLAIHDADDGNYVGGIVRGVPRIRPRASDEQHDGDRRSGMGRRP